LACCQLNVVRNVIPIVTHRCATIIELSDMARAFFRAQRLAYDGHPVVLTASHPVLPGADVPSNFVKVLTI
jgi:hypothetical protein